MKEKFSNFVEFIIWLLSSSKFIWVIVALFVLQASWIAVSFKFPMIYDEGVHLTVIKEYSGQLSPYLANLSPTIPFHYSFFHYLMSFPYNLISFLTNDLAVQVVFLRIINILMFAFGLLIFNRLLKRINIKQIYINVGILVFTLLPITPLVAATINYDNMLFLLTAVYFLICVKLVMRKTVVWYDYAGLVIIGCLASLVKYTFLPIFAVSVLYLAVLMIVRYGRMFIPCIVKSFKKSYTRWKILLSILLIASVGFFSAEYIQNIVRYGEVQPSCFQVVSERECRANPIINRNIQAKQTTEQRPVAPATDYSLIWFKNMLKTTNWSGNSTIENKISTKSPLPIMDLLVFIGVILGVGVLVYTWRSLPKNSGWYFLFAMTAALFIVIFIVNVRSYYIHHAAFANQPRYLLHVLPILLTMIAVAVGYALRNLRWLKVTGFVVLLVLFTQGGGLITHILRSDTGWYWQEPVIIEANDTFKDVVSPLVKE